MSVNGPSPPAAGAGGPPHTAMAAVLAELDHDVRAALQVRELLSYLPSSAGEALPLAAPLHPELSDPGTAVPPEARRSYDVREALQGILDRGCLLERTWKGAEPLQLPTGEKRAFLEDGDEVILTGYCRRNGFARIGLGRCSGVVQPHP